MHFCVVTEDFGFRRGVITKQFSVVLNVVIPLFMGQLQLQCECPGSAGFMYCWNGPHFTNRACVGTQLVPLCLDEADNNEHEDSGRDCELSDFNEDPDLSDYEATELPPSVCGSKKPCDITVTFDGTWSKLGFTALYGVVVVISLDTGRVLDTHVLCKYCTKCSTRFTTRSPSEFDDWY